MRPPAKLSKAKFIGQIRKHSQAIAKHRDALRELVSEAEQIADCCDDAVRNLDDAVDVLSEYL